MDKRRDLEAPSGRFREVFTLKSIDLLLDFIIEQSLGPTFVVDHQGVIVRASPEVRQLGAGDVQGRHFDQALPLVLSTEGGPGTGSEAVSDASREFHIREVLAGAVLNGSEAAFVSPEGTRLKLLLSAKPLSPVTSLYEGALIGLQDITQRNGTKAALRLSEEKLLQSQKMEAVGRMAGGIAHDFNNLLTAINGYSSLALAAVEPENPVHGYLEEIQKAGERAASLTNQLLAYSRKQILTFQVTDLNALVKETMAIMRRTLGEQISYGLDLAAGACPAKVDPGQLQQALINLAINARDAMPEGGRLDVSTKIATVRDIDRSGLLGEMAGGAGKAGEAVGTGVPPGEYVRITLEDTGHGMDADVKKHLFEPFFTTKGLGKGTGLGLSMVYGIIKQFKGHIQVFSEPGRGTTVHLLLPHMSLAEKAPKPDSARPEDSRGTETVLLVEDEDSVLKLLRQVLGSRGYKVLTARDGREALAVSAAHKGSIDILVTDMVMHGMGGQELAHSLRQLRPETRMMFISGYTEDFEQRLGLQKEGVVFLQKPFTPEMLARTVRAALDKQGRHTQA